MSNVPPFLVINLDRSQDRLLLQEKQFKLLGLAFERIQAVDGEKISSDVVSRYAHRTERILSPTEVACLLSHKLCWERVTASARGAVVLEDDAVVAPEIKEGFAAMAALGGTEVINLETRSGARFVGKKPVDIAYGNGRFFDLTIGTGGATAYFVTPQAAELLLRNVERKARIADTYIYTLRGIRRLQADPALAVQMRTLAAFAGMPRWKESQSTISTMSHQTLSGRFGILKFLRSRIFRGFEQFYLLVQKLSVARKSVRRRVEPSASLFAHFRELNPNKV